jgi:hypothetical protein
MRAARAAQSSPAGATNAACAHSAAAKSAAAHAGAAATPRVCGVECDHLRAGDCDRKRSDEFE